MWRFHGAWESAGGTQALTRTAGQRRSSEPVLHPSRPRSAEADRSCAPRHPSPPCPGRSRSVPFLAACRSPPPPRPTQAAPPSAEGQAGREGPGLRNPGRASGDEPGHPAPHRGGVRLLGPGEGSGSGSAGFCFGLASPLRSARGSWRRLPVTKNRRRGGGERDGGEEEHTEARPDPGLRRAALGNPMGGTRSPGGGSRATSEGSDWKRESGALRGGDWRYLLLECSHPDRIRAPGSDLSRKLRATGNWGVIFARHFGNCSSCGPEMSLL